MLTKEQIEERQNYIGASESAAVLGLSRWSTPLQIWCEKTGQLPPKEVDSEAAELGNELEDYVARRFMRKTGLKVHRVNETLYHKKYPFIACHVDRRIVGAKEILQCKTASGWKAKEWDGEEIPREYIIQEHHELAVTGAERAHVAVLIGNQDFKIKVVERDEAVIADVVKREVHFWKTFIEPKVMPMSMTSHDKGTLDELFPVADEKKEIALGDDALKIIEQLEGLNADGKTIESQQEKLKNDLRAMMGDAERGVVGDKIILWTNMNVRRLNTTFLKKERPEIYTEYAETDTTRRFLIKDKKGDK